ncbi:MAG: sigma-54 dependent transcriptional regulator [Gammaproteobacteria bacterium]|nr:sigma-54 dependent transcriptional regulator [Gammaproteobacteria bacterium]
MSTKHILIVDDEPDICELLEITLGRMGLTSRSALNYNDALELIESQHFDLCLTDMKLPDGNGIELVEYCQQVRPELPIAVITAHGNMESAVSALKAGAFDFVSKPLDINILRNLVSSAIKLPAASKPDTQRASAEAEAPSQKMLGESPAIKSLIQKINKLSRSQAPVFIHGESGSGKELAARMIHDEGPRKDANFVPVNCGAIPADLMESEFFGHLKGSFSGATSDKQGLFQVANGGTLFLDEVAELPLHMQVKLLRAIQEKAIRAIGAQQESAVDVRILSASHRDLAEMVEKAQFRQDLFYRINVIELEIPSLRTRITDIPLLAKALIKKLCDKLSIAEPRLTAGALDALLSYSYPGNIRELENILERAIALAENNSIQREDLNLSQVDKAAAPQPAADSDKTAASSLEQLEKQAITEALEKARWNKTAAAKILGITLRQLRYRMDKMQIE